MPPKKYYGIKVGRNPGIYNKWALAEPQISGYPGAVFKGFETIEEAKRFVGIAILGKSGVVICKEKTDSSASRVPKTSSGVSGSNVSKKTRNIEFPGRHLKETKKTSGIDLPLSDIEKQAIKMKRFNIFETYTDGSWKMKDGAKNKKDKGPGGWAFIIIREISNGVIEFKSSGSSDSTTNVEMEHVAMLNALKELKGKIGNDSIYHILYSDNNQVLKSLSRGRESIFSSSNPNLDGWIVGWKKRAELGTDLESVWKTSQNTPVEYQREVSKMEVEVQRIIREGGTVRFVHVTAHKGIPYNEKVDALANAAYR